MHGFILASSSGSPVGSLVGLVVAILEIVGLWKVFSKAGQPGWAAIIPIYNLLVLLRVVGRPWWWIILMIIPFVNLITLIIVYNDLSKSFGHGVGFTVGLVLLGPIFVPILGFGDSQYSGPRGQGTAPAAAPAT